MSKNKSLFKNTVILGIGQFVPKVIALITLPIFTTYLSTKDYGIYDLIISFSSLFLPILTLLIQQAVFRFIISEKNKSSVYITNSVFFIFIMSTLWLILLIIGIIFFELNVKIAFLVYIFYLIQSLNDVVGQIARGFGRNILWTL